MKDLKKGHRVRINTPGESHHDRTGTVTQASTTRVWVAFDEGLVWMYFHSEVDILN